MATRAGFDHGGRLRTGVLLVQLGTPEAAQPDAVRRYLAQFLGDRRVVELPRLLWWPILHGIILRTRPSASARKYASIWTDEGSPLMVHTRKQAALLRGLLGNDGYDVEVEFAMRYGEPAIGKVLAGLRDRSLRRLLVLPLYPQYAGSTTATVNDEIFRELAGWRDQPELRMVRGFCDDPGYIDALALGVERHWARNGRAERLLMSFHGVPRKTLDAGDPYHCECHKTARLLAQRLGLPDAAWQLVFQSRFGRAKWLEPYTSATLARLAKDGVKTVDVICPGFVSDCLETLEEIAIEARESFVAAGGEALRYIPCLNESDAFVAALGGLVKRHLSGWPVGGGLKRRRDEEQAAQETAMRARALGAKR